MDIPKDKFHPYWVSKDYLKISGVVFAFKDRDTYVACWHIAPQTTGDICWQYSEMFSGDFVKPITYAQAKALWPHVPYYETEIEALRDTLSMKIGPENANHPEHPFNKGKIYEPPQYKEEGGPSVESLAQLISAQYKDQQGQQPKPQDAQQYKAAQEQFIEQTKPTVSKKEFEVDSETIEKFKEKLKSLESTQAPTDTKDSDSTMPQQSPQAQQQMIGNKLTQLLSWCQKYPAIASGINDRIKNFELNNQSVAQGRTWKNLSAFAMSQSEWEKKSFNMWYEWAKQELENSIQIETAVKSKEKPMLLEVEEEEPPIEDMSTLRHFQCDQIVAILKARSSAGYVPPLWLFGAPGAGKTHIGKSVAQELGLKHYPLSLGPTTTESKTVGFKNLISGDYIKGHCYDSYKSGGLCHLDEVDAADPGVLVALNAILANDQFMFPNDELVPRHKNFIVLATANTIGTGSMHGFQRNRLDAATLDRFVKFKLHYDTRLERILSGHKEWTTYVVKCREFVEKHCKESLYITPRASINGAALLKSGIKPELVAEICIFNGMSESIAANIKREVGTFVPKLNK